jgi:iron complex outermembrane receptor protein
MKRLQWLLALGISSAVTGLATMPAVATVAGETWVQANNSCLTEPVNSTPRSVTIVEREQIQRQAAFNGNLIPILVNSVPGLSQFANGERAGLSLRGRRVSILIDGVPVSAGNLALLGLNPDIVERIEVIPGSNFRCRG